MKVQYSHLDNEKELLGRDTNNSLRLAIEFDKNDKVVSKYFIKLSKQPSQSIIFSFIPRDIISKHVIKQYRETSFAWINNQNHILLAMQPWETTLEAVMKRQVIDVSTGVHIINQLIEGFVELERHQVFFDFDLSCVAVVDSRTFEVAINPPCSLLLYEPANLVYRKIHFNLVKPFVRERFDLKNIFKIFCQILRLKYCDESDRKDYEGLMNYQLKTIMDEKTCEYMKLLWNRNTIAMKQVVCFKEKPKASLPQLQNQMNNQQNNLLTASGHSDSTTKSIHQSINPNQTPETSKKMNYDYQHQLIPTKTGSFESIDFSPFTPPEQQFLIQRNSSSIFKGDRMCLTPTTNTRDIYQKAQPEKKEVDWKRQNEEPQSRYKSVSICMK